MASPRKIRNPLFQKLHALDVHKVASQSRHGNLGSGRFKTIDENGMVGIAGDDVIAQGADKSRRVWRFAEPLVGEMALRKAEIDPGVTGLTAGLMAMSAIVVEVRAGAHV